MDEWGLFSPKFNPNQSSKSLKSKATVVVEIFLSNTTNIRYKSVSRGCSKVIFLNHKWVTAVFTIIAMLKYGHTCVQYTSKDVRKEAKDLHSKLPCKDNLHLVHSDTAPLQLGASKHQIHFLTRRSQCQILRWDGCLSPLSICWRVTPPTSSSLRPNGEPSRCFHTAALVSRAVSR